MFQLRYVASELRRRAGRTVLTALALAAGVGLVIAIVGVSQGLDEAESQVLSPVADVSTDVLVTRVAGAPPSAGTPRTTTSTSTSTTEAVDPGAATAENGGALGGLGSAGGFFGGGAAAATLNEQDAAALLSDNDTVLTDLAKLGPAGTRFVHDFFLPATLLTFPDDAIAQVAGLPDVTSAVGGLTLVAQHETGTVPNVSVTLETGEQQIQQTLRPEPLTRDERQTVTQCLRDHGLIQGTATRTGGRGSTTTVPPSTTVAPTTTVATTTTTAAATDGTPPATPDQTQALDDCLPARLKEFVDNVVVPAQTIQKIANPPSTDAASSSYTAAGVDPVSPKAGLITVEQVKGGRFIEPGADNEVLLSIGYANKRNLEVGSNLPINGQSFDVVGLVDPALTGNVADVYFTLAKLQQLADKPRRINQVLVKAKSSADVDKVAKEVSAVLPGAQVVTTKALSHEVTGSLADANKLANRLRDGLIAVVLLAGFALAVLLTLTSVAGRAREIGTLRALGWSNGMVGRQVLAETAGMAVAGAVIGVAIGGAVAAIVGAASPPLHAASGGAPVVGSSQLGTQLFGPAVNPSGISASVHLHVPVHAATLVISVAFAVVGGLVAGAIGGWRAARMSPAAALRDAG